MGPDPTEFRIVDAHQNAVRKLSRRELTKSNLSLLLRRRHSMKKKHNVPRNTVEKRAPSPINRRGFLKCLGVGATAATIFPTITSPAHAQQQADAFKAMIGKDKRMIVHNWRPGVVETPLALLREHRVTPKGILFVRNNQVLSGALTIEPIPLEGWTVEMIGLLKYPRIIKGEDLARYEQVEVEMVLQCSGNGRSYYGRTIRTRGTQWQKGGLGNLRWKGVPLKTLIEDLKPEIDPAANFVTAEGKDPPLTAGAADFEHSVPLDDVLDKAILAVEMNGEPIPAIHGGPVRLIIPGYYGTMNIKWLSRLRFEAQESNNYNHIPRYRTFLKPIEPGTNPPFTFETTVPNWRQKIKSIIWAPLDRDVVKAGTVEVEGVAWNDGMVEIQAVEVSIDGGKIWRKTGLETPSSPYAWYHWKAFIELSRGEREIWARAVDASGRIQPLDGSIHWNPSGYEWYGVDKIKVTGW